MLLWFQPGDFESDVDDLEYVNQDEWVSYKSEIDCTKALWFYIGAYIINNVM